MRPVEWHESSALKTPLHAYFQNQFKFHMTAPSSNSDPTQTDYQSGKRAFERGEYRKSVEFLEKACASVSPGSVLGGEIQTWLVTAYEAAGQRQEAIDLCRKLTQHPNLKTRKEGKRILYILEAPKLKTRPEWLTEIPDLAALSDSDAKGYGTTTNSIPTKRRSPEKPKFQVESVDLSQVNTEDNRFIWVALLAILVVLGSLLWLS